jgi:hypothetical protein
MRIVAVWRYPSENNSFVKDLLGNSAVIWPTVDEQVSQNILRW